MIDIKTENEGKIIKISDNWCDKQTESKIRSIMTRLNLSVSELVDWEILVDETIYPTEKDKELANDWGDKYLERDRHLSITCEEEDGSETVMSWVRTLDMEIRAEEGHIELYMLFIRS